ncbi:MAG: tyrosine-type recombinase/integrase [Anaerolineales bacterium]|nr:tyrosine-type recombinase/integrase [Anaerolineales bacterium]
MPPKLIDPYKAYLENEDLSALTITGYLTDTRLFIKWFEKHNRETFTMENVTPSDIREYRQYLQNEQGFKASTVNRKLASLASLMNWGIESGQITTNPTENVKTVQQSAAAPRWLDKSEQFALQRAIEKDLQLSRLRYPRRWVTRRRDASLIIFLLHTGLRLSEMVSLELSDVQITNRKGITLVRRGKGNKERRVPLNAEARKALQEWLAVRPQVSDAFIWIAVEATADDGISGRAVQRILCRYAQDAGLEELTPHVLRHTFAKNLANKGVGLEKIAALLGHASLNTTRIYITPDARDLERAVEQLEE